MTHCACGIVRAWSWVGALPKQSGANNIEKNAHDRSSCPVYNINNTWGNDRTPLHIVLPQQLEQGLDGCNVHAQCAHVGQVQQRTQLTCNCGGMGVIN